MSPPGKNLRSSHAKPGGGTLQIRIAAAGALFRCTGMAFRAAGRRSLVRRWRTTGFHRWFRICFDAEIVSKIQRTAQLFNIQLIQTKFKPLQHRLVYMDLLDGDVSRRGFFCDSVRKTRQRILDSAKPGIDIPQQSLRIGRSSPKKEAHGPHRFPVEKVSQRSRSSSRLRRSETLHCIPVTVPKAWFCFAVCL